MSLGLFEARSLNSGSGGRLLCRLPVMYRLIHV